MTMFNIKNMFWKKQNMRILKFWKRLEALAVGIAMILFWKGVWNLADLSF